MSIIGIVLGTIAIGLIFWNKKSQDFNDMFMGGEIGNLQKGYKALMDDFNNYQIETDRKITQLEKNLEYQNNKLNKQSNSVDKRIDNINKSLPLLVRNVIGHIEFAKPLDKK